MNWMDHLLIVPVLLPLVTAAVMMLVDERRKRLKAAINVASCLALVGVAISLMARADAPASAGAATMVGVYRLGDWPVPFGIVLVLDRMSALMLVLTGILALSSVVFSVARWHRAGAHFHSLFQFLLMGLNGAFLTGDLFNLFVFFEVLLAASYGLVLHGSELRRVKAGLHYIAVNLLASSLFLIGVSLIYSVTGSLNMADLAVRIPQVASSDRMLLEAGAGVLGVAFLIKAGMWPLCFWLPSTYSAAAAPVAAMFSVMTKVGVYVLLRLSLLFFGEHAGASAHLGETWLLVGGLATLAFGAIGVLATQDLSRLAGFSVLVSSGTLLAAVGTGLLSVTSGTLYYLVTSTITLSAFFLLIELVERGREPGADVLAVTREAYGEGEEDEGFDGNEKVGIPIPATVAVLGVSFIGCALLLSGLPPLSGFLAKFAILTGLFNPTGEPGGGPIPTTAWVLLALLIGSGLSALIAMTRAGIRTFWAADERTVPHVRILEMAPVALLLLLCVAMTVKAGPVMRYLQSTAESLHSPQGYIRDVLGGGP